MHSAKNIRFLSDISWLDTAGDRHLQQQIFDSALVMIEQANEVILLDMFLFNSWQGPVPETHRALADELTAALLHKKNQQPSLQVVVITDPINTVYGSLSSPHFDRLRDAGVHVVLTDLTALQDSNAYYSAIWRWLIRPFGSDEGMLMPNPFGPGRVSLRSYFTLANFKANHRKLLVADDGSGELQALVTSANPHNGSSAHRNVAILFDGDAVWDIVRAEVALLALSGASHVIQAWPEKWRRHLQRLIIEPPLPERSTRMTELAAIELDRNSPSGNLERTTVSLQIVNEANIKAAALLGLANVERGDKVDLAMFYLADRAIVDALKSAHARGARLRIILDVNQDAFGRAKNGVPNRPVAAELDAVGISIRWCATAGEQCHAKMLQWTINESAWLLLGSGNFTRRNLEDFNLETDVLLQAPSHFAAIRDAHAYFEEQWNNAEGRLYSVEYGRYADDSLLLKLQYRVMEATGLSTF